MPKKATDSRKKLCMPLVGVSLPERSGVDTPHQEHSQHMPVSFPMPGVYYAKVLYIWYSTMLILYDSALESLYCDCPILIL